MTTDVASFEDHLSHEAQLQLRDHQLALVQADNDQLRLLLDEAVASAAEFRQLFAEEQELRQAAQQELTRTMARLGALEEDLTKSGDKTQAAQVRLELENLHRLLGSLTLTFKDWMRLSVPTDMLAINSGGPSALLATFRTIEEALESSQRFLPVTVELDKKSA